jgi:queuine tRNA-ribosyltransferase catalytic subunit
MRWLDRNLAVHDGSQALFPIVQGGLDLPLRRSLAQQISQRKVLGFAIGGLSGGEGKEQFWQAVS